MEQWLLERDLLREHLRTMVVELKGEGADVVVAEVEEQVGGLERGWVGEGEAGMRQQVNDKYKEAVQKLELMLGLLL